MDSVDELKKVTQKIKDNSGVGQVPTLIGMEEYEKFAAFYGRDVLARLVEEGQVYIV